MDLGTIVIMTLLQLASPTEAALVKSTTTTLGVCWETAHKVNADANTPFVIVCSPYVPVTQANEAPTPTPNS